MPIYTATSTFDPVIQTYFRHKEPPTSGKGIRYAIAQGPSRVATKDTAQQAVEFNLGTLKTACQLAGSSGYQAQLISFPELFLSGYEFGSVADTTSKTATMAAVNAAADYIATNKYAEENGPVSTVAKANSIAIICPMPYKGNDDAGHAGTYDAAVLFGSDGKRMAVVFKTHLWGIEERTWFDVPRFGTKTAFPVNLVNGVPVGVAICYDAEFPEVARCLALNGAVLTAMPTAAPDSILPGQTEPYPDIAQHYIPANALQNQNFCSYGNRAGDEYASGGTEAKSVLTYSGNSIICNPYGQALVRAARNEHALLIADCIRGDFPLTQPDDADYLINRRPQIYTEITDTKAKFPYGKTYSYPDHIEKGHEPPSPSPAF